MSSLQLNIPLEDDSQEFVHNGYCLKKSLIVPKQCDEILARAKENISKAVGSINISMECYLSAVSRWADPSPILDGVLDPVYPMISEYMSDLLQSPVKLKKWNLICKNTHCCEAIPYHQDISYSPHSPYQATAWLSLNTIEENSGPLAVFPKSHREPILPAIDFWSPDFVPQDKDTPLELPTNSGDVVCFDSRLWHGSKSSKSKQDRYALVTRWSANNYIPPKSIPPIQPHAFGMWTCGKVTHDILQQGAKELFDVECSDFIQLLDLWITELQKHPTVLSCKAEEARESLSKIRTLHLAHEMHNGGDATGLLYKTLWHSLLYPLKNQLDGEHHD